MTDARPKLAVVSGGGANSEPASEAGPGPRAAGRLAWVLGALLVLALVALGLESQRAAQLSARVEGLAAELSAAQATLEAHRRHLREVRASVAELQALVEQDPVPPPQEVP